MYSGTLPDHVVVDPRGKIAHNVGTNCRLLSRRLKDGYSNSQKIFLTAKP